MDGSNRRDCENVNVFGNSATSLQSEGKSLLHSQLDYFRELPAADVQRGLRLQSLQRKYINTKPLASLFSLVNISNTECRVDCVFSPRPLFAVDVFSSDGPGENCSGPAGNSSAPFFFD